MCSEDVRRNGHGVECIRLLQLDVPASLVTPDMRALLEFSVTEKDPGV